MINPRIQVVFFGALSCTNERESLETACKYRGPQNSTYRGEINSKLHMETGHKKGTVIPVTHLFQAIYRPYGSKDPLLGMHLGYNCWGFSGGTWIHREGLSVQLYIRSPPCRPIAFIFAAWSGLSLAFRQLIRWVSWRLERRWWYRVLLGESWEAH